MKYSIVYSSVTGNTAKLAEVIKNKINPSYFGPVSEEALTSDVVFVGFWATRNSCGADVQAFIEKLSDKKVFLFGTAGYNNTQEHFDEILNNVKSYVPASNTIIGTYMCQGKVSEAMQNKIQEVKPEMYEAIKDKLAESVAHPNQEDLNALISEIEKITL